MTDESQQQETEHVRQKAPSAPGDVGEEVAPEDSVELLYPLEIVRVENTEPKTLFGLGSKLILRASDTGRMYVLTHEEIETAVAAIIEISENADETDDENDDQEELETAADEEVPVLNAAARICEQLNRIGEALGADAIPFLATSDLDDVGRVEFRLMDIASALERLDLARPA